MEEPNAEAHAPPDGAAVNNNAQAWQDFARHALEWFARASVSACSRPSLTMGVFLPGAYLVGRLGLVSTPLAVVFFAGLMKVAWDTDQKHRRAKAEYFGGREPPAPLFSAPPGADGAASSKEEFRKRAESVEWLNQFVRHVWLRYPNWVGDWLIRDVILGEILEGLRRDKVCCVRSSFAL
jgi:hypothetical protein